MRSSFRFSERGMLVIFRGTLRAQLGHSMGTLPVPVGAQLGHSWGKKHSMGTVWQGSVHGHSMGTVGAQLGHERVKCQKKLCSDKFCFLFTF